MSKVNASWNRNDIQDLSSINQEQEDKIKRGINQAFDKWAYNQIIHESYRNYLIEDGKFLPNMSKEKMAEMGYRLTQEEFINKCKTDPEFSEKWRLKIEERELSLKDRLLLLFKRLSNESKLVVGKDGPKLDVGFDPSKYTTHEDCDKENISTKLITLTYQNETIQFYE